MTQPLLTSSRKVRIFTTNEFKVFNTYHGIRDHLTKPRFIYDQKHFVRKEELYSKCKTKYVFQKLSINPNYFNYLLANLIHDPNVWVGNLLSNDCREIYESWLFRNDRLTYQFKEEIIRLLPTYEENFKAEPNQHPHVLKLFLSGDICIETFVILLDITKSFKMIDKNLKDDFLWKEVALRLKKYRYFLNYDEKKMKVALLERFST